MLIFTCGKPSLNPTEEFTLGGSYAMLNSIYVRYVRSLRTSVIPLHQIGYYRWGAFLQSFDRRNSTSVGFRRSPERSSGPILIYYDGYYPLANSIDVRSSVS